MRTLKSVKTWAAAAGMLALVGTAQAALVNLGNGTVKDTNTNLIWLQDWSQSGSKNQSAQSAWAEGLNFGGSTDWHLPSIGEYEALFTAYGNLGQVAAFTNVQNTFYWSSTIYQTSYANYANPVSGQLNGNGAWYEYYAVAVRRDDRAADVPEPQTLALALVALGATVVARRNRPRSVA